MRHLIAGLFLAIGFVLAPMANAQASPAPVVASPKPQHAAVKVARFLVKAPYKGAKGVLYTALFSTEVVVDGAHAGLDVADKVGDALSANSKIPVLAEVYVVISQADKDVAKLDSWLERQEQGLFGTSN